MGVVSTGIGVVVPYDFALDRELWRWAPEGVDLYLTRTPFEPLPVGLAMATAVGDPAVVARSVRDLGVVEPRVVAYACTSGSFVGGRDAERVLAAAMRAAGAQQATTTSGSLLLALETLGITRVAVATPYDDEVTGLLSDYLGAAGFEVAGTRHLGLSERIWEVPAETTARLVRESVSPGAEAVFASCTNLPTYDLIAPLEAELGIPVLTANQVTLWAALAACGRTAVGPGQRLLEHTPTPADLDDHRLLKEA
jgi:maleate isomerase